MPISKEAVQVKGFSLIELLIVVAVIGIIASIAIPQMVESKVPAYDATAKSDLRNAMTALEMYNITNGTYPATSAELESRGYSLSPRVSWDKYDFESGSVHMHVQHENSPSAWHAKYPEEGTEIEIR